MRRRDLAILLGADRKSAAAKCHLQKIVQGILGPGTKAQIARMPGYRFPGAAAQDASRTDEVVERR